MHELSIADAILEKVRAEAVRRPRARLTGVGVRVGALSGVAADALSFGFACLVKGTELDALDLQIESTEGDELDLVYVDVEEP
jgi:Zn finger protein HypA/HybF involved in hydrogenase expression